jgi:hypothetical protein
MFYFCGIMEYMCWSGYCTSKYGLAMTRHNGSLSPAARLQNATTQLKHCMHDCFKGSLGGAEAWAGCMSSLTQLVFTPATPLFA